MNLNRRRFVQSLAGVPGAVAATENYNVLFLMSDEHSPHAAGCLGNRIVKTPAIDSLAREGALFTAAYCQNPICVPSRASFVTGRMPSNVGVFGNDGGLREDVVTMADVFKQAGYSAAWFGKTHWGGDPRFYSPRPREAAEELAQRRAGKETERSRLPKDATVADWPATAEGDTITKEQALRFLKESRDRPFFAGVSFVKPHFPFVVQEEYYRMYRDSVDIPRVTAKMIEELPEVSKRERETYGFASVTESQMRKARAIYYGMVTYIDDQLRDILKTLDELGLREKTIILYTADHGELAGEHGLWYKNSFYEAGAGIPFIWSFPKAIPKGVRIGAPVMNMDIFPTLCDLCGLTKPVGLEGRSLLPLMKGQEDGRDRHALAESFRGGFASRMIRTDRWKYCYFHEDREQLFDVRNDPAEERNLAGSAAHRTEMASLKARALKGWNRDGFFEKKKGRAGRPLAEKL